MDRSLGRTIKSNFAFYETDGLGRDGYISYNNGGFWKDNLKFAVNKPKYDYPHYSNFRSLTRFPAPFKYYSDGSGRDTYIIYNEGGLVKGFTPYNAMNLSNYLRHYENVSGCCSPSRGKKPFLSQSEIKTQTLLGRIQKNVVGRLYDKEKQKFLPNLKKKLQMRNINMFYSPTHYDPLLRSHSTKNFSRTASCGFFSPNRIGSPIIPSVKLNLLVVKKKRINK